MGCHTSKAAVSATSPAKTRFDSKAVSNTDRLSTATKGEESSPCSSAETTDPQVALLTAALQTQTVSCKPADESKLSGCSGPELSISREPLQDVTSELIPHILDEVMPATDLHPDNTDTIPATNENASKTIQHSPEGRLKTIHFRPSVFGPREEDLPLPSLLGVHADTHALPVLLGRTSAERQVKGAGPDKSMSIEQSKPVLDDNVQNFTFAQERWPGAPDCSMETLYSCMGLRQQIKDCSGMSRKI